MGLLDRLIASNVEKFISWMINNGEMDCHFDKLDFAAAKSYAKSNGAIAHDDMPDCFGFDKNIRGENHWVSFFRAPNRRGTTITLSKQTSLEDRARIELDRIVSLGAVTQTDFESARDATLTLLDNGEDLPVPSWSNGGSWATDFVSFLLRETAKVGVNEAYCHIFLENSETREMLLGFVAILEERGVWFPEQKEYAVMFVKFMWDSLGEARQNDINARYPS